ncbi:Serine-threonine protein kinase FUSED [Klebsormidium nitens]|uniref:Serine-threonine protein kinase FUSED n=1 Tax=Klebsormidium nitens TaxID=105231 RepID=A0A0U9HJP0_KLENI|nr:Serine-threonine protein kinase FUSED [Klebsormidium nitens]|eukprot:GAQ82018.1 Serine-threonine protein kinase FUSED [Klebsormidium nitens]
MNNYHIYETIGRGKHSVVYKGRKKKTIQYFAVKSVEKLQKPKVLQEVRTLHSLEHENVLRFHAWYETSNHLWLILEYCVGGNLLTLLHQDTRLPEESIHDFARDLVKALQFLHSNGVVYCDLKPSNILLDENGRLKLCDFGLARRLSDIQKFSLQQLPQAKRGTPCYMAPELFQEGGVHSFASDLWAVGCVLYECATGQPPFVSNSFTQLVSAILETPLSPLPASVSPEFADLVQRLLVKDPVHRISWPELRVHPFWRVPTKELPLPEQPAFDHFLRQRRAGEAVSLPPLRGATPPVASGGAEKAGGEGGGSRVTALPELAGAQRPGSARKAGDVNVLRLSQIVQKNFRREADGGGYRQGGEEGGAHSDVTLENNDIEIDLAEEGAEGGEDEGEDTSGAVEAAAAAEGVKMPLSREDSSALNTERFPRGGTPEPHRPDDTAPLSARTGSKTSAGGSGDSRRGPPTPDESPDDSSSDGVESAVQQVAQSQLLWHQLDLAVKPIVLNRRIEKVQEPTFDPRALPVEPLSGAALAQAPPDQSEAFLARIMASISGATSLNEKLNTLSYVETLATETDAANHLINSQLMPLLVRMLKISKPPVLRAKLASAMGLLVRHATVIDEDLAASGIVPILTEAAKDKQERVKRRAIASLGELLFYIATQSEQSPKAANSPPAWEVPEITFTAVGSMLRRGEDEVAQHYAVKTMENIASQGGAWASKFASGETVANLVFIFQNSKLEHLRATAGSCLVRLARFHPPVLPAALEKLGVRALVRGLAEGSSKTQQTYLNLLNMGLQAGVRIGATRLQTQLMAEERGLVPTLVGLLEHASEVLRAKALVAGWALCQASTRWLVALCNAKVTSVLERLARDRDEYVQRCLEAFLSLVAAMALPILDQARAELSKLATKQGRATPSASPRTPPSGSRGPLGQAAVLLHLVTCQLTRSRFADGRLLSLLGVCLARSQDALVALDASPSNSPRAPKDAPAPGPASPLALVAEFQSVVLQILEALSQGQTPTVLGHKEATVQQVLPVLADLYRASKDGDRRFMCLKDEEPIPTYAQKLLALLLDRQCVRIPDLLQLKLLPRLFDFLAGDPETINSFALKLCLAAISAPEVPTRALSEARVCARLGLLLQDVAGQGKDDFVEPVVAICRGFLERHAAAQGRGGGAGIQDIAELALSSDVFLALVGSHEDSVADAASHCVALLSVAAPRSIGGALLQNVPQVLQVLETANKCQSKALLAKIQHRLLSALREACKQQRSTAGPSSFNMSNVEQLETLIARLRRSTSSSVTQAANDLAAELARVIAR